MIETKIRVRKGSWNFDGVEFLIYQATPDGKRYVAILDFREVGAGIIPESTGQMTQIHAQQLMDDLWDAGLRPTEGAGSAGSLAATQKHLEDLRAIVANRLGVGLPGIETVKVPT